MESEFKLSSCRLKFNKYSTLIYLNYFNISIYCAYVCILKNTNQLVTKNTKEEKIFTKMMGLAFFAPVFVVAVICISQNTTYKTLISNKKNKIKKKDLLMMTDTSFGPFSQSLYYNVKTLVGNKKHEKKDLLMAQTTRETRRLGLLSSLSPS